MAVLEFTCNSSVQNVPNNSGQTQATPQAIFYLDAHNPTLIQPIVAADKASEANFVQVEVAEVHNPTKYAATFRVDYQTKANKKIFLGTFSLYPSDNPGEFIVPTEGKLQNEGAIVLSLVIPDDFKSGDILRAGVRRIQLVKKT